MEPFKYFADLRFKILETISGVENADHSLFWDNTIPNYITKNKLEDIYSEYLSAASSFGLYIVCRHIECQNPMHGEYPTSNNYGLSIPFGSNEYIWNGGQMYQGSRICVCPCSSENKPTKHGVIDDVVYDKNADLNLCKNLEDILSDINEAANSSGDKRPRSAIREYLLRAVIRINDQLLPEPMDKYVHSMLNKDATIDSAGWRPGRTVATEAGS